MGKIKFRTVLASLAACFALTGMMCVLPPAKAFADTAADAQNARNEKLVVRYAMNDTPTALGGKIAAQKWDSASQSFVANSSLDATIQLHVNNKNYGAITSVDGIDGTALKFTQKAHARANFKLPDDATGMTISMWVKDINSYWSSLIEFWDGPNGSNGGRFGKGTMQGNGGRSNEGDPWSSNCSAHGNATMAEGGGWDSFCINVNSGDNGGAAVDPMVADTWYSVTYVLTTTEMKAYRNGELKQTFDKGNSANILQSIFTAVKSNNGKLGIRLTHDANDGDILDDLRIYSYAMTGEEVKDEIYAHPSPIAAAITTVPEYYDEIDGLGYPQEMLFDGATSLTTGADGTKTGVTARGVTYSYKPLSGDTTYAKDSAGVKVTCSKGGYECEETIKFRRTLNVQAQSLGYKIGNGESIPVEVPQDAGEDIIVKVAANTDLSNVQAGNISVKQFEGDATASHYTTKFLYSANTQTASVRCSYTPYPSFDTLYTIHFIKKSTETFGAMSVTNGKKVLNLTKEDFANNSVNVGVSDLNNFTLNVSLTLAEGAQVSGKTTFTQSDLSGGKLALTVVNENGDAVIYYLVPVACSSDATLSALSAGSYGLNFAAGTTEYTVAADKGEGAAVYAALTATANDAKAIVKKIYDKTENVITVTVTAEDGTAQNYVVKINERDTDATLSEIKVGGVAITGFDPAKTAYTVKYAGALPAVTATATSEAAGEPSISAADADGKVKITVTAENGATKEYTVTLVQKSNDAELKKLTLNGSEITFTSNTAEYLAPVGTRLSAIVVIAKTADSATATYKVAEANNQIIVTVTAEDGTAETYTVTVNVQSHSLPDGGETEDNSPSGCNSSVGGTAIALSAVMLSAGLWLFVKKERKSR